MFPLYYSVGLRDIAQTSQSRDLANADRSSSASAASGLQPIAARHHARVSLKNSALLPVRSNHRWHGRMITWGFARRGFPVLGLWLGVPAA